MAWINLRPAANQGGGRQKGPPTAKVYETGQTTLSHATVELLGSPSKVLVSYEPDLCRIRLVPTTPGDKGGFGLSGGGNSPQRMMLKIMIKDHPDMIGDYEVIRVTGGVELVKEQE